MSYVSTTEAAELQGDALLAEVERRKASANDHYKQGRADAAMQAYLAAIWLLKINRPPYPEDLSTQLPPTDQKAARLLGRGRTLEPVAPVVPPKEMAPRRRLGLQLPGPAAAGALISALIAVAVAALSTEGLLRAGLAASGCVMAASAALLLARRSRAKPMATPTPAPAAAAAKLLESAAAETLRVQTLTRLAHLLPLPPTPQSPSLTPGSSLPAAHTSNLTGESAPECGATRHESC